jgi:hypothetical protein
LASKIGIIAIIVIFVGSAAAAAATVHAQTQPIIQMFCQNISPIGTIQCTGQIIDPAGHGIPQGGTLKYTLGEIITYQCLNKQGKIMNEHQGPNQLTTQISGSEVLPNPGTGFSFIIGADKQPPLNCKGQGLAEIIPPIELTTQTTQYIVL